MLQKQLNPDCKNNDRAVADRSVMIVDDDVSLRKSIHYGFESCGLAVTICENAKDALLFSRIEHFDYIVVDYDTRGMNGLELVRRLRERSSSTVMIGTGRTDMGRAFLENGANDFLLKPFAPYILAMMIDGGDIL
jgi:two-component system copper resistance phosphate regulon response regulator CusR